MLAVHVFEVLPARQEPCDVTIRKRVARIRRWCLIPAATRCASPIRLARPQFTIDEESIAFRLIWRDRHSERYSIDSPTRLFLIYYQFRLQRLFCYVYCHSAALTTATMLWQYKCLWHSWHMVLQRVAMLMVYDTIFSLFYYNKIEWK